MIKKEWYRFILSLIGLTVGVFLLAAGLALFFGTKYHCPGG